MAAFRVSVAIAVALHAPILSERVRRVRRGGRMVCPDGVPLCGVLMLSSGLGERGTPYEMDTAGVHGLWPRIPERRHEGTSMCIPPTQSSAAPSKVYDCYRFKLKTKAEFDIIEWERHVWEKHGMCAGVRDADDYFRQMCALASFGAAGPLKVMQKLRESGAESQSVGESVFDMMVQALQSSYPVWEVKPTNKEISLSVCAGYNGRWKLSTLADMPYKCGFLHGVAPSSLPPGPAPREKTYCSPRQKGPECKSDGDCSGLRGCIRCGVSGHCTSTPSSTEKLHRRSSSAPPGPVRSRLDIRSPSLGIPRPPSRIPVNASCGQGKLGPRCPENGDCSVFSGCASCTDRGFCTDSPSPTQKNPSLSALSSPPPGPGPSRLGIPRHSFRFPANASCGRGKRGPPCPENGDCSVFSGCDRCTESGYCTQEWHSLAGQKRPPPGPAQPGKASRRDSTTGGRTAVRAQSSPGPERSAKRLRTQTLSALK